LNEFERKVEESGTYGLRCRGLDIIQVNLGLVCNQSCSHCHLSAGPGRTEAMGRETMEYVLSAVRRARPALVDLTGGAPELNPYLTRFITALKDEGADVQVRTNLTALFEPGLEGLPEFYREHGVRLVASMPCYLEENVRAQRGTGVYEKSVEAIRRLNALGYGVAHGLQLDLVYNPGGAFLPPDNVKLEEDYRRELGRRFGLSFTHLITIANMPIGRFWRNAGAGDAHTEYMRLLMGSFNKDTLDGLMCRHQVCVSWDGTLYDCDFNIALGMPVEQGVPGHISGFDPDMLAGRRVITGEHCFGCTAGCGSSCRGALV